MNCMQLLERLTGIVVSACCFAVVMGTVAKADDGELTVVTLRTGYLIVEGRYIQPPYVIEHTQDTITINGQEFDRDYFQTADEKAAEKEAEQNTAQNHRSRQFSDREFDVTPVAFDGGSGRREYRRGEHANRNQSDRQVARGESIEAADGQDADGDRRRGRGGWGSGHPYEGRGFGGPWGGGRFGGARSFYHNGGGQSLYSVASDLRQASMGGIVAIYPEHEPLVLYPSGAGYQLLQLLTDRANISADPPESLTTNEASIWSRLVADFRPSGDFTERAELDLRRVDEAGADGERTSASVFLSDRLAYPLSLLGMVGVVLGFGHLLSNRPTVDTETHDEKKSHKIIVQSLVIIALFSIVDLVWTLTASNAGAMKELNPLGSQFISDARLLTLFKLSVTGMSIGILYTLRRKPIAHLASWWCCLLMTLLTARWVVFQSMFL